MDRKLRLHLFITIAILGSLLDSKAESPKAKKTAWATARNENPILDSLVRFLSLRPLQQECAAYSATKGIRLTSVSSWGFSVFTVLFVGEREIRNDKIKIESGCLLVLDRGGWGEDEKLFESKRTAVPLTQEQTARILAKAGVDKYAKIIKVPREKPDETRGSTGGGSLVIEWVNRKDMKALGWPSGFGKAPQEIIDIVKVFNDLLPTVERH